ncbi:hypothetical protein [Winogradskyella sp. 3972H.M.0a.05]|uniref:hypothetical protein n=1 Tax=Winogradskyella sp. 3972H.M.0a.05 TaxID=2950277 RepID=UPI003391C124
MKISKETYNSSTRNSVTKTLKMYLLYSTVICYIILAFASLTSCSNEDSPAPTEQGEEQEQQFVIPTLELVNGTEDLFLGVIGAPGNGSLQHSVKATAPEGFVELVIYKVVNGVQSEYQTIDTTHPNYVDGSNTFTYDLSYIFTNIDIDQEFYFIAEVRDIQNNTETLEFADAWVKQPMQFVETIFMETRLPLQPDNMQIAQFLEVNGNQVGGVNLNKVINEQINEKVAAVISVNEVEGIFISSVNAAGNASLVDDIDDKSTTKFKELNNEVVDTSIYDIYDTFTIEALYENAAFGDNEQKALQIGQNSVFAMRTDDNRTALFKITYYEVINNSEVYLTMDMYITQ